MGAIIFWLALALTVVQVSEGNNRQVRLNGREPVASPALSFTTESWENIVQESRKLRYPAAESYHKRLQEQVPENVPFKCDESTSGVKSRSETRPLSVHRLRPGDIDVIAALGDSIAAGNGAREVSPQNSFVEDRGVAFTGGGIGTWRSFTTIPNILKVFNPKLVGHAVGKGSYQSYNAQLNVAVPASIDDEAVYQTKFLVDKMKRHPEVDFEADWKFLSILIGHNDVCSLQCFNKTKHSPEAHKQQLQLALDYLYNNVPRLFVSIIPLIDPSISARVQTRTLYCNVLRIFVCNCLYQKRSIKEGLFDLSDVVSRYQEAERQLVYSGRYDGREDFTVELQPFSKALNGPRNAKEKENKQMIQFFNKFHPWTPECFHFNQKGMAFASIALWNNLMEPAGNKSETFRYLTHKDITCPTKDTPYLFTRKNSIKYYESGHQ